LVNDYWTEKTIYAANLQQHITKNQYNETSKFFLQKHFDLTDFVIKAIVHTKVVMAERDIKRKINAARPQLSSCARQKRVKNLRCKEGVLL